MKRLAVLILALILAAMVPITALAENQNVLTLTFTYGDKTMVYSTAAGHGVNTLAIRDITEYLNPEDGCMFIAGWSFTPDGSEPWIINREKIEGSHDLYPILQYTPKGLTELIGRYEYMDFDGNMMPELIVTEAELDYDGDYHVTANGDTQVRIRFRKDVVKRIFTSDNVYVLLDDPYEDEESRIVEEETIVIGGEPEEPAEESENERKGGTRHRVIIEPDPGDEVYVDENGRPIVTDEEAAESLDDEDLPGDEELLEDDELTDDEEFLDDEFIDDEELIDDEFIDDEEPIDEEFIDDGEILEGELLGDEEIGLIALSEPEEDTETAENIKNNTNPAIEAPETPAAKPQVKEEKPEPKMEKAAEQKAAEEAPKKQEAAPETRKAAATDVVPRAPQTREAVKADTEPVQAPNAKEEKPAEVHAPATEQTPAAMVKTVSVGTRVGFVTVISVAALAIVSLVAITVKRTQH